MSQAIDGGPVFLQANPNPVSRIHHRFRRRHDRNYRCEMQASVLYHKLTASATRNGSDCLPEHKTIFCPVRVSEEIHRHVRYIHIHVRVSEKVHRRVSGRKRNIQSGLRQVQVGTTIGVIERHPQMLAFNVAMLESAPETFRCLVSCRTVYGARHTTASVAERLIEALAPLGIRQRAGGRGRSRVQS